MRRLLFAPLLLIFLAADGCQSQDLGNDVAALKVTLTAAEIGGKAYVELPLCETTTSKVCSEADISAKIKVADQAAFDAVMKAGEIAKDPNATKDAVTIAINGARIAIAGLSSLLPVMQ